MQPIHYYFRHLANENVHNEFYNFSFLFLARPYGLARKESPLEIKNMKT